MGDWRGDRVRVQGVSGEGVTLSKCACMCMHVKCMCLYFITITIFISTLRSRMMNLSLVFYSHASFLFSAECDDLFCVLVASGRDDDKVLGHFTRNSILQFHCLCVCVCVCVYVRSCVCVYIHTCTCTYKLN